MATGDGIYHITDRRFPIQDRDGDASTDIAVLKLPKRTDILDHAGDKLAQPALYDGSAELNNVVWFAGYGRWGSGTGGPDGRYVPTTGPRRAAAASVVSQVFGNDYGIGANFEPVSSTNAWSRVTPGDDGSAWWQQFNGQWAIVATTQGGSDTLSSGARVSKYIDFIRNVYQYIDFIRNVYPDALLLGDASTRRGSTQPVSAPAATPEDAFISPFVK